MAKLHFFYSTMNAGKSTALLQSNHNYLESNLKTILFLPEEISKKSDKKIIYVVKSRSFLQHQVRSMIGAIKYVGEGKWNIDDLKKAIEKKNRNSCPPVAPPCGLYLFKVQY